MSFRSIWLKNKGWEESELSPESPPPITRKLSLGFFSGFVHILLAWLFCWVQGLGTYCCLSALSEETPCLAGGIPMLACKLAPCYGVCWECVCVGGSTLQRGDGRNRKLVPGQY